MQEMPIEDDSLAEYAEDIKTREDLARELMARHKVIWGDGPPYFSLATHDFWRELHGGKFHLAKCGQCSHAYFPPRVVCPECWAQDAAQLQATPGEGVLVTFTDLHVTSPALKAIAPVRMAIVDLDEGIRVLTWLRGPGSDIAEPGRRCRITVEEAIGRKWFTAQVV